MKKVIAIICVLVVVLTVPCCGKLKSGTTVESREEQLDKALSKSSGNHWNIEKEMIIDDHIISGASDSNGKAVLAIFKPDSGQRYQFAMSSGLSDKNGFISMDYRMKGQWHCFVWFCGAQTEYAEVITTVNNVSKTEKYDTSDMDIIDIPMSDEDYSLRVTYVDSEGRRY